MDSNFTGVQEADALDGRSEALPILGIHFVNDSDMRQAAVNGLQELYIGMGCFWGVERIFWQINGVVTTSVGYGGGYTPNATYKEVCTGMTGHAELVRVVFDPEIVSLNELLKIFWEKHDPTQGMRQGGDIGTQYRSALFVTESSLIQPLQASKNAYQQQLTDNGLGEITTQIDLITDYYHAEEYHQQYLAKNPDGYCGIGGTGVSCPI